MSEPHFQEFRRRLDREIATAFGLTTSQLAESNQPAALTAAKMLEIWESIPKPHGPTRIVFTMAALRVTTERQFAGSRHRSRRVLKKLIKRHGGEFRRVPAMWRHGDVIYAHPSFRAQIEAATVKAPRDAALTFYGIGICP